MTKGNKGFESFVSSLISAKKTKEPLQQVQAAVNVQVEAPKSDADLLRMMNGGVQQQSEQAQQRVKNLGLGYDKNASQTTLTQLNHLQKLKEKMVKKTTDDRPKQAQVFTPELSKSRLSKKITKTAHDEIQEQRKHKLQQRIESKAKAQETTKADKEEKEQEVVALPKKHFKKRDLKKTRSKLKNRKKDNRPPEVLQKKFGSILNL